MFVTRRQSCPLRVASCLFRTGNQTLLKQCPSDVSTEKNFALQFGFTCSELLSFDTALLSEGTFFCEQQKKFQIYSFCFTLKSVKSVKLRDNAKLKER